MSTGVARRSRACLSCQRADHHGRHAEHRPWPVSVLAGFLAGMILLMLLPVLMVAPGIALVALVTVFAWPGVGPGKHDRGWTALRAAPSALSSW